MTLRAPYSSRTKSMDTTCFFSSLTPASNRLLNGYKKRELYHREETSSTLERLRKSIIDNA